MLRGPEVLPVAVWLAQEGAEQVAPGGMHQATVARVADRDLVRAGQAPAIAGSAEPVAARVVSLQPAVVEKVVAALAGAVVAVAVQAAAAALVARSRSLALPA